MRETLVVQDAARQQYLEGANGRYDHPCARAFLGPRTVEPQALRPGWHARCVLLQGACKEALSHRVCGCANTRMRARTDASMCLCDTASACADGCARWRRPKGCATIACAAVLLALVAQPARAAAQPARGRKLINLQTQTTKYFHQPLVNCQNYTIVAYSDPTGAAPECCALSAMECALRCDSVSGCLGFKDAWCVRQRCGQRAALLSTYVGSGLVACMSCVRPREGQLARCRSALVGSWKCEPPTCWLALWRWHAAEPPEAVAR